MGETWQFRSADGSGNSRYEKDLGASNTPYSRSCSSTHPLPDWELPDPGVIFDLLIKRDKVRRGVVLLLLLTLVVRIG
jgi:hypothetical protein